ncbi:hypothetical protein ACFL5O_03305 [Myxococcota bacterium]
MGTSVGTVYFSVAVEPATDPAAVSERRVAWPDSQATHTWPIAWLSRAHVYVEMPVRVEPPATHGAVGPVSVRVGLDTGSSNPVLTSAGLTRFGVRRPTDSPRSVSSFNGEAVPAFPVPNKTILDPDVGTGGVGTPVWMHVEGDLYGVDVVASPLDLTPQGGAIRLDLARSELVRCESLASCLASQHPWSWLEAVSCPDTDGLLGVRASLGGVRRTLMLDTGGLTLFTGDAGTSQVLKQRARHLEPGTLVGASHAVSAVRATGAWTLALGRPAIQRTLTQVWIPDAPREGAIARCFPDGSLGLDALGDCALVLEDAPKPRALLRCASDSSEAADERS